mmetsp:Transcript_29843/g.77330  ORF Transcript_29843/g.77330 Transcript_29843/m.77330 type:complete len:189 (-) Transcript_29843:32-598(-)|eukprot:scaffold179268_cov21-Tisochrysis_lutea.AAC.1
MQAALLLGAEQAPPMEPQMPPPSASDVSSNATTLPFPSEPSPCTSTPQPQVFGAPASSTSSRSSYTWPYYPPAIPPSNQQTEQQFSPQWPSLNHDHVGSLNLHEQACNMGHQPPLSNRRHHAAPLQASEWDSWEAPLHSQFPIPPAANPNNLSSSCQQNQHSALESRGSDGGLAAVLEVDEYELQQCA